MSAAPEPNSSKSFQKFKDCLSCRIIAGGGLIMSAGYVYFAARSSDRAKGPTVRSTWQISFAIALLSLGAVIILDPVGKIKKEE